MFLSQFCGFLSCCSLNHEKDGLPKVTWPSADCRRSSQCPQQGAILDQCAGNCWNTVPPLQHAFASRLQSSSSLRCTAINQAWMTLSGNPSVENWLMSLCSMLHSGKQNSLNLAHNLLTISFEKKSVTLLPTLSQLQSQAQSLYWVMRSTRGNSKCTAISQTTMWWYHLTDA